MKSTQLYRNDYLSKIYNALSEWSSLSGLSVAELEERTKAAINLKSFNKKYANWVLTYIQNNINKLKLTTFQQRSSINQILNNLIKLINDDTVNCWELFYKKFGKQPSSMTQDEFFEAENVLKEVYNKAKSNIDAGKAFYYGIDFFPVIEKEPQNEPVKKPAAKKAKKPSIVESLQAINHEILLQQEVVYKERLKLQKLLQKKEELLLTR